jgi:NitT/TauT family transport system substrate-binding protein
VLRQNVVDKQRDSIRHLLEGWFDALDFLHTRPDAAASSIATRLPISPEQVLAALQRMRFPDLAVNRRLIGGPLPERSKPTQRLMQLMRAHQLLPQDVDPTALFTDGPLQAVGR